MSDNNELSPYVDEDEPLFGGHGTAMVVGGMAGAVPLCVLTEVLNWGMTGFVCASVVAGVLAVGTPALMKRLPEGMFEGLDWRMLFQSVDELEHQTQVASTKVIKGTAEQSASPAVDEPEQQDTSSEDDTLFVVRRADDTGGIARLTIDQIVAHCEPNSYKIWIGRSLTQPGNPAVQISIYKQHFRFMGASQRGKSSMVAAFLDIVTRTHDKRHVQIALLDKENQTGNLFAYLPHVPLVAGQDGKLKKLHARNEQEVLEGLMCVVAIMKNRSRMSKMQILEQPILLVYLEEFLSLKNYFKVRMDQAKSTEEKEQATSDYRTFVYCIEEISQVGLKYRVQLLLCAQVEYADDDFREALVNVACGFSFCVRPTAAAAAGFRNKDLIRRNAQENKIGQAVVETPDCSDLVLAPDYDLEARLIAFEQEQARTANIRPMRPPVEPAEDIARTRTFAHQGAHPELEDIPPNPRTYAYAETANEPVGRAHEENESVRAYRLSDAQIAQFCVLYPKHIANKDKALVEVGANTNYRAHANELIQQYGLDRKRGQA